jgi:transcriptional regulator with XRE-family HTH domain
MEPNHKLAFGRRIRELRKRRGLSQMKLAEQANLHLTYVTRIEKRGSDVGLGTLLQLAKALKVTPSKLLEGIQ